MDLLFSSYGVGDMPKSAMAEVERRAEDLLKSSSFQRMLELEKKHKMQRLRGVQPLLPTTQPPAQLKDGPPSRPQRPDSLFPQENYLALKAAPRTVVPLSLSITIPQPTNDEKWGRSSEGKADRESEQHADNETPTNSDTFQKQVKFLEGGDDGEDGMSEQSSICQSPSWEGYGQRKKEKKLEAERRKKEKGKAEKEAKAARKRNTARLSKPAPPPTTIKRDSRAMGLTNANRSMSDPLLITQHLIQDTQSIHRPDDIGRAASADDLQQIQKHQPAVAEVLSASSSYTFSPRPNVRRSMSEGPAPMNPQSSPAIASTSEARSPRDAFPPSASRTPMLRHMSPSGSNHNNNLLQGAANVNRTQESLSNITKTDGGRRDGYVLHQRAQAAERGLASLADEQLIRSVDPHYPPKSSPAQLHHTRRLSLTQEAKSAAMRLVGMRAAPAVRDDGLGGSEADSQSDYLTFKAFPYSSSSDAETATLSGVVPVSPDNEDYTHRAPLNGRPSTSEAAVPRHPNGPEDSLTALERPPTSQSSVSSSGPSITSSVPSNHSKKSRSLKDAAKAALNMSRGPQKAQVDSTLHDLMPPYFAFRSRMHSRSSVQTTSNTSRLAAEDVAAAASQTTVIASVPGSTKQTEIGTQGGCQTSEGSSSSSAYEDGSPLPSPTTTPDTSRPQSTKDLPLTMRERMKENFDPLGLQDDERTLRQSLDSSKSSTPHIVDSEAQERTDMGIEDRWSRTALPIDIDCDAQSFTTSVSNLDNMDDANQASANLLSTPLSTGQPDEAAFAPISLDVQQPTLSKSPFNFDFGSGGNDHSIFIPPRSKKRDLAAVDRLMADPVATSPSREQWEESMRTAHGNMGVSGEDEEIEEGSNSPRGSEGAEGGEKRRGNMERYKRKAQQKHRKLRDAETGAEPEQGKEDEVQQTGFDRSTMPQYRDWAPESMSSSSSTAPSASSRSPTGSPLASDFQIPSNPYFADFAEPLNGQGFAGEIPRSRHASQPQTHSTSTLIPESPTTSGTSTPSHRASGIVPVSILKQPKTSMSDPASSRPHILSSLPKHMQLQAGISARPPAVVADTRLAPIAKMFVECCSCKFYHDMPSKIYECMAKPDAVVEDRVLGISGAITTMVKCPWCQHNMSRNCCAGYAAVVYLKEKLH